MYKKSLNNAIWSAVDSLIWFCLVYSLYGFLVDTFTAESITVPKSLSPLMYLYCYIIIKTVFILFLIPRYKSLVNFSFEDLKNHRQIVKQMLKIFIREAIPPLQFLDYMGTKHETK